MVDNLGRTIDYMRISITDKCNLNCIYCNPKNSPVLPKGDILRYEEILEICKVAAANGITNFKVTGGEPLTRKGCINFLHELKKIGSVSLTTNGTLLEQHIPNLTGINVNISLNSLDPITYKKITGHNTFYKVWNSLNKALEANLNIKINCVPLKNLNNIIPIAQLAEKHPISIRFIEYMPNIPEKIFSFSTGSEIYQTLLETYPDLNPIETQIGKGPAKYFKSKKLKGNLGLITAIENSFCQTCNRIRLTSQGFLKLCLFHDQGLDLRRLIRNGEEIDIVEAIKQKPPNHQNNKIKNMPQIGG